MPEIEMVSIASLAGGALAEEFTLHLARVIADMADVNTTEAKRTITLKVSLKPNERRTMCEVEVTGDSTLAPSKPTKTQMFFGMIGGVPQSSEYHPEQTRMAFEGVSAAAREE